MIVVGVAACYSAVLRFPDGAEIATAFTITLSAVALAFSSPLLARPGRRMLALASILGLWPLSFPLSLHVGWAVLRVYLGHPPGPPDHGFLIGVVEAVAILFLMSSILSMFAAFGFSVVAYAERPAAASAIAMLLLPVAWIGVILIGCWDPVQAFWWFWD